MSEGPFERWFEPARMFADGHYPKGISSALKVFPELRMEIQKLVVTIAPRRALEVGPGDRPLVSGVRGAVYLDVAPAFLRRLDAGARVVGDLRAAPFRDGAFDLVVASDVLTHIPPPERRRALGELLRLAPRVLIFSPEAGTPEVESSPVSTAEIVSALEGGGCAVERKTYVARAAIGDAQYRMALVLGSRRAAA